MIIIRFFDHYLPLEKPQVWWFEYYEDDMLEDELEGEDMEGEDMDKENEGGNNDEED